MTDALRQFFDKQAIELEEDVQSALEACGGDPMRALAAALIANSFLMDENEKLKAQLKSQVSSGFARVRNTTKKGS